MYKTQIQKAKNPPPETLLAQMLIPVSLVFLWLVLGALRVLALFQVAIRPAPRMRRIYVGRSPELSVLKRV